MTSWVAWFAIAAVVWVVYRLIRFSKCAGATCGCTLEGASLGLASCYLMRCRGGLTKRPSLHRSEVDLSLAAKGKAPAGAFRGKTIWITGASQVGVCPAHGVVLSQSLQCLSARGDLEASGPEQGLGKALALHFGHHGSRIILSARNETALKVQRLLQHACLFCVRLVHHIFATIVHLNLDEQAVQAECLSNGAEAAFVVPVDLCSLASVKTAVEAAGAAINGAGIDFLIHNAGPLQLPSAARMQRQLPQAIRLHCAGASQRALAEEIEPEVVERMFSLNSVAPINLTRLALPLLLKNGSGRVVAVSSMAGPYPCTSFALPPLCDRGCHMSPTRRGDPKPWAGGVRRLQGCLERVLLDSAHRNA